MKNKQKSRVIAWVLSLVMLVTSLGLDSLPVMAAQSESENGRFTYEADFAASYNTASMTFTLKTIDGEAPTGTNNVDVYIKSPAAEEFQQIGWYQGLNNNQLVLSEIKYQYQALTPGVTYDMKIKLRHDNQEIGEAVTSFTTKEVTISCVEKLVTWFSAEYQLTVAQKEALAEAGITELKVYPYIQEKGGTPVKANVGGDGIDVLKEDLTLRDLKEDTEYTVYFAGLRDKAEPYLSKFEFKTIKDTRELLLTSTDVQYCYATFNVGVTGGREDVETKSYLFLRKKGDKEWRNQKQNDKKKTFARQFKMSELDPVTQYEYVLAIGDDWNVNSPDAITKEGHKITGSFTTPEDPRELSVVCSAGYQTALIRAGYTDNNLSGVQSVIHVFVRKKGTQEWTENKNASYDAAGTFDLCFKNLEQDTEYEYRAILNSRWDRTTADDVAGSLQYKEGSFKTSLCQYTLKLTPDTEKSLYNREYLDVQLGGSQADRKVRLAMLFNNLEIKEIDLYQDEAYQDTFSLKGLSSDTTYYLAKYAFYVEEYGDTVCIKDVLCEEKEFSFHTPKAVAPEFVRFEQEEIYLNAAQKEEDQVGNLTLRPVVNDEASDEMLWQSKDPSVAAVDETGKVTAVTAGETEIVATSKYDETVSATIKVSVDSFYAVYAESREMVGDDVVKGLKGTKSVPVLLVKEKQEDLQTVTGYLAERSSVVSYDTKENTIGFGSVGTTKLYLCAGEYKVRIHTESYVKTAAYYVDSLYNASFPAVETKEDTYSLAGMQNYQIVVKSIDGSEIKNYSDFEISVEKDPGSCVEVDGESFVLSAKNLTAVPVKITISPKEGIAYDNEYYQDAVFYVNVKALPEENEQIRYVYTNVDKYLSDVKLKEGWKWENEKLSLYALRRTQFYDFNAYYAAEYNGLIN